MVDIRYGRRERVGSVGPHQAVARSTMYLELTIPTLFYDPGIRDILLLIPESRDYPEIKKKFFLRIMKVNKEY